MKDTLTLGTRGSPLARRQAQIVLAALQRGRPEVGVEVRVLQTEGDRRQDVSLEAAGGQGIFVKDIELRLLAGEIDLAVHSLKDMPARTPPGLLLAAMLPRGDARDALVTAGGRSLEQLPSGARIGSDSRRRAVQLLRIRPDLRVLPIRGNVDTRVRKVERGEYEGAVLAAAGLERLGLLDKAARVFTVEEMLPAVGQGVLAVECREDDFEVREVLSEIDDDAARCAATAERALLQRLGAGCRLPVGAYAELRGGSLELRALLADAGGEVHRVALAGPAADAGRIGREAAEILARRAGLELADE